MTSTSQNISATHNSGNTPTTVPSTAPKTSDNVSHSSSPTGGARDGYPEQIHAGAVGFGPNYPAGPTFTDKVQGLKEEIKGKLTNNPDLVQHGRDIKSGEERMKKLTGEDELNPFADADKDEDDSSSKGLSSKESSSSATIQSSGNIHPRHQSHPMQPAVRTEPPKQHHPSESSESSERHQTNDTNANANTGTTYLPGLNSPFGLLDGKIQTIVGTPDLAPTTASQQPAFQKDQHTNDDKTPAGSTGSNFVPHAPVRETAPTSLPFETKPPRSIKEQQDQQMTRPAHSSSSLSANSSSTRDSSSQSQSQVDAAPEPTPQTLAGPIDVRFLELGDSSLSSGGRDASVGICVGDGNGNKVPTRPPRK